MPTDKFLEFLDKTEVPEVITLNVNYNERANPDFNNSEPKGPKNTKLIYDTEPFRFKRDLEAYDRFVSSNATEQKHVIRDAMQFLYDACEDTDKAKLQKYMKKFPGASMNLAKILAVTISGDMSGVVDDLENG